jgi:hypothetical protein
MESIAILLSILMFLTTVVYVYYTSQLVKETVRLRELETNPFIGANIHIGKGFSMIVVKNIGKVPAYNLSIHLEEKIFEDIKATKSAINYTNIQYFGVEQEISIPFDTRKLIDLEVSIALNLKYESKDDNSFNETIILSLESEKQLGAFYPKYAYDDKLKDIKKELQNISNNIKNLKG